jgi:pimeloyl-ACP methyl ester carboxylesterase
MNALLDRWLPSSILLVCLFATHLATAADGITMQTHLLEADDGTRLRITTGSVSVPERHARAVETAGRIRLSFVRVQLAQTPTPSAHILLAGGPGASGVDGVLSLAKRGGKSMLELFGGDIVGMDQRGSGGSTPSLAVQTRYDFPLDQAGSLEAWLPRITAVVDATAADLRARGIDLGAYNTRESADDVDALRDALGYRSFTLWGRSYGTHLALAVLRQHPQTVDRIVLIGPEGPDHTWKLPSQVDAVIQRLGMRAQSPDLPKRIRTLLAQLQRKAVTTAGTDPSTGKTVSVVLGPFDLQLALVQALGSARTIATLPRGIAQMQRGDFSVLSSVAVMQRQRFGVGNAMKPLMNLASSATPSRLMRIEDETNASLLGDALDFPERKLASVWPAEDLGDDFRAAISSDLPVLILVGDLDVRTPVENAREIATTLPNASVVVVENGTHDFNLFGSPVLRELLAGFLAGKPMPQQVSLEPIIFRR